MGELDVRGVRDDADSRAFTRAMLRDLAAFQSLLERGAFVEAPPRCGVEQEMFLIDDQARPVRGALDLLREVRDERFTHELALFNLEVNLSPDRLQGGFLGRLERQLGADLQMLIDAGEDLGIRPLLTGILPSLRIADLCPEAMTPVPRYRALTQGAMRLRGGQPFHIFIRGSETFESSFAHVMPEAANASLQLHLQVTPEDFAKLYNIAQLITAPLLATATNSPLLCGRRLWQETRVALFERATDARSPNVRERADEPRVPFGQDWIESSVLELLRQNVARFQPLLSCDDQDDSLEQVRGGGSPKLHALMLHNGTVWRWNRPCYGAGPPPHLRIENRILPSGPTVLDEVANAALFYGLMAELPELYGDPRGAMSFKDVRSNFVVAARMGLYSSFRWLDCRMVSALELLSDELLPAARRGLERLDVPGEEIDRYLGVIEGRLETGLSPSLWALSALERLESEDLPPGMALARLTESLWQAQISGQPLHERPFPEEATSRRTGRHASPGFSLAGHVMRRDLYTVSSHEAAELAFALMQWRAVRHIPVEDENGAILGCFDSRSWLHWHRTDSAVPMAVGETADPNPLRVQPGVSVQEVARAMVERRKHVALVQTGEALRGVISERDLLRYFLRMGESHDSATGSHHGTSHPEDPSSSTSAAAQPESTSDGATPMPMIVSDLMTERVFSLEPEDTLAAARDLMWEHDIRHVPIVDDDEDLVGLISQRDLARAHSQAEVLLPVSAHTDFLDKTSISEVMSHPVATADPGQDVREAAQLMFENKYGCLPVVNGQRLVGILTEADFVRLLAEGD